MRVVNNSISACMRLSSDTSVMRHTQCYHSLSKVHTGRGVAMEFARGGQKRGLGDLRGRSRGKAPVGCGSEAPRSRRQMLISSYDGGHAHMSSLVTPLYTGDAVFRHI